MTTATSHELNWPGCRPAPGAFAVHADGYAIAGERAGEGLASELRAWSVLNISDLPLRPKATSSVSIQNATSIVIYSRHDSTRRLDQSSTTKPRAIALQVMSIAHTWFDRVIATRAADTGRPSTRPQTNSVRRRAR